MNHCNQRENCSSFNKQTNTRSDMSTRKYASKVLSSVGKKLYMNADTANVYFVFESDGGYVRVPAHKVVLAGASDVFHAMFFGTMSKAGDVKMVNCSVAGFKRFLKLIYFDELELTSDHIYEIINLSQTFNVTECLTVCGQFLADNLDAGNVCVALRLAILFNHEQLKRLCDTFISINTEQVLKSAEFLQCDKIIIGHILKLDTIYWPETVIFDACMAWAKARSKQGRLTREIIDTHLGELFYEIRFGAMTMDEFTIILDLYSNIQLFTSVELDDINHMIANKKFSSRFFNGKPRQKIIGDVIECFRDFEETDEKHPYFVGECEVTTFSVNETLLLTEFFCTAVKYFHKYKTLVEMFEPVQSGLTICESNDSASSGEQKILYFDKDIQLDGMVCTSHVLDKPIIVRKGIKYDIRLEQEVDFGYPLCTDFEFITDKVQIDPGIVVEFHSAGNRRKNGGLVTELDFQRI